MITRRSLLISIPVLAGTVIAATALGQESRHNESGWRATIECDAVVLYSQMSTESKVVGHLKKGNAVRIHLEVIGDPLEDSAGLQYRQELCERQRNNDSGFDFGYHLIPGGPACERY